METRTHRTVIVGGGAGGLELAVRLATGGERNVLLIDRSTTHVWKPRLHEMAVGMQDGQLGELDYAGLAARWGFAYERGTLSDIDPDQNTLTLAAEDGDDGRAPLNERRIGYQALVLAVGGVTPDMGTPGVLEHAVLLDRQEDARTLFRRFSSGLLARSLTGDDAPWQVVIVGSGQTGVELAAHLASDAFCADLAPASALPAVRVTILEATDTFMSGVNDKVREAVYTKLRKAEVEIHTGRMVSEVSEEAVDTDDGSRFPADLTIWAAGRVGPAVAEDIAGLACNKKRQWLVRPTLQTTHNDAVFALGDCAYLEESPTPPTAQAASEQARHLAAELPRYLAGQPPASFRYQDHGTVLSLGAAGSLGKVRGWFSDDVQVRGRLARATYRGLQRQHQFLLVGPKSGMAAMAGDLFRTAGPRLKVY